jgi:hypothetical protein
LSLLFLILFLLLLFLQQARRVDMKTMAALDAITNFISYGCPAGGAIEVQPLATSGAECRF